MTSRGEVPLGPVLDDVRVDPELLGGELLGAGEVFFEQHARSHQGAAGDTGLEQADRRALGLNSAGGCGGVHRVAGRLTKVLPLAEAIDVPPHITGTQHQCTSWLQRGVHFQGIRYDAHVGYCGKAHLADGPEDFHVGRLEADKSCPLVPRTAPWLFWSLHDDASGAAPGALLSTTLKAWVWRAVRVSGRE